MLAAALLAAPSLSRAQPQKPNTPEPTMPQAPVAAAPPPAGAPDIGTLEAILAPVPSLPDLPRGATPPTAVIGVLSVTDAMRKSTAGQHAQQVLGERQRKFDVDARREQAVLQATQQELVRQRSRLPPAQLQARVRAPQQRAASAQRRFAERGRVLQDANQYVEGQIQQALIPVIRQVAESRGVTLLLHRSQVAHGLLGLDLTDAIVERLNKVLPDVTIPPDGAEPPLVARAVRPPDAPSPSVPPPRPVRAGSPHR